jgi:hypothetical protein
MPLEHSHYSNLRFRIGVDVPLRRTKVRMSREFLDVFQRSAYGRDLATSVGDEGPPATVAGAADEAEVPVPPLEHVHDGLR